ncbi:unnamed protein product [Rotaria sp. Silwood2]|nr:unnamed protein product [Rotaria sp. Silwood2]CAF3499234.1 unnamed protein product [Rotaria sp. Silwood2]CAF4591621.1 unnamed protein product [Rotaria sp. Silwood2]CAF4592571.1 unnamed protein product [Rotaria sp. Silwood2]CAF4712500.1 unnamed protein product [Rotaria sp. Silwood2]
MSNDELELLHGSITKFISITSFFSTSFNRQVAASLLGGDESTGDLKRVLFEIEANPQVVTSKPFADITSQSQFDDEAEVLFMLGSIFRLVDIRQDGTGVTIIRMILCGDDEHELKELLQHMKTKLWSGPTDLCSFGEVLKKMGKFDLAEKFFHLRLKELPPNDPNLATLYHNIGSTIDEKGDYETSLEWYKKALETYERTSPPDHVSIGNTYNSIGLIHWRKGDYSRAVESYNNAVSVFEQAHDENHPNMAGFYNNIAIIYGEQKKYSEALVFFKKTLTIQQKYLPAEHPDLGMSYNNIGEVHRYLGQYDLALEYYNRALKIYSKSLTHNHPQIALSCRNVGLVHESNGDFQQAMTFFQKAASIRRQSLPPQHPDVVRIEQDLQRTMNRLY